MESFILCWTHINILIYQKYLIVFEYHTVCDHITWLTEYTLLYIYKHEKCEKKRDKLYKP